MKKVFFLAVVLSVVQIISCGDKHTGHGNNNELKATVDSLIDDVDDDHIAGMAKMGKLTRAEQTTRRLIDSIAKLPAKSRQAAEPLKIKLDSLQKELSYAEVAMDKWMRQYKGDSVFANIQERIDYLNSEKLKVTKVKEAILNGIQKADSLLKEKF